MGNFGGHALPGSFFIIIGFWWLVQIFIRYYQSSFKGRLSYRSSVTFKCSCLCGRLKLWELEGAVIIFFCVVGFTLEIITAYKDGVFTYLGNGQHATMFFFFGLAGFTAILVHHQVPLPKKVEYITMTVAFCIEGLLFKFHLHGRDDMDVLLHTFLLYAIYGCVISCIVETMYQQTVLASLMRSFFVILQGTWFWQVGFVLYNPMPNAKSWDHESHEQMMIITMMFAWHIGVILIGMLVTGSLIGCIYRRNGGGSTVAYDSLNMNLVGNKVNGQTRIELPDDSDSDLEMQRPIKSHVQL